MAILGKGMKSSRVPTVEEAKIPSGWKSVQLRLNLHFWALHVPWRREVRVPLSRRRRMDDSFFRLQLKNG
jgi:hypothetical protein